MPVAKTPTPILQLVGSRKAEHRADRNFPDSEKVAPDRPDWFVREVREHWDTLTPQLDRLGLLTRVDQAALVRYCELWVQWKALMADVHARGRTYTTVDKQGNERHYARPEFRLLSDLNAQLLRLEQEFGLTPSSRAGLNVEFRVGKGGKSLEEIQRRSAEKRAAQ